MLASILLIFFLCQVWKILFMYRPLIVKRKKETREGRVGRGDRRKLGAFKMASQDIEWLPKWRPFLKAAQTRNAT